MQLSELLLNRQLYRAVQDTSTQDASYMSANNSQSAGSGYSPVTTGAGEAAYAVNSNTPTVTGTKIRAGYIDSENYSYVSGNYTVAGMRIDLNNGAIYAKNFAITSTGDAYFTGNISATSGTIGGWVISNNALSGQGIGTIQTSSNPFVNRLILSGPNNDLEFWNQNNVQVGVVNTFYDVPTGSTGISLLSTLSGRQANVSAGNSPTGGTINLSVAPAANYNDMSFGMGWNAGQQDSIRMVLQGYINGNIVYCPFDADLRPFNPGSNGYHNLGADSYTYGIQDGWASLFFLPLAAAPPSHTTDGKLYYNSSLGALQLRAGGSWQTIATGSVSLTLSALSIDTDKNWAGYRIFNMASLTIAPGGYITLDGVARTTWPSGGTTTLSGLTIDVNKNWGSWGITSVGTITQDPSASFYTNWIQVTGGGPQIGTSGGRFFTYASTLNYTTLVNGSDRALKENITPIEYGLATIQSLVPVRYKYIESPEYHLGFIAQDVEGVIPEIVSVDEETQMLGLSSTEIIAILVKAVQELKSEVELLKASL